MSGSQPLAQLGSLLGALSPAGRGVDDSQPSLHNCIYAPAAKEQSLLAILLHDFVIACSFARSIDGAAQRSLCGLRMLPVHFNNK